MSKRTKYVVDISEAPLTHAEKTRLRANAKAIRVLAKAEYKERGGYGVSDHPDHIAHRIAREHAEARDRFIAAGKPVPSWVLA